MIETVIETNFPDLKLIAKGKVRDMYDLGDSILMVTTDRLSAFDVVMPDPIPGKGKVLNQLSLYWFDIMKSVVGNHLITGDVEQFPKECKPYTDILKDRSMLVKKAKPLPIECVVRGYISGSGWKSYQEIDEVCGILLPKGLLESDKLDKPIFTPSTKEEVGQHDININFDQAADIIGKDLTKQVMELSLAIYSQGAQVADKKGIIIADTKFEFGFFEDELILIDEVLTPDSSRFWSKSDYKPGSSQKSFDKQFARDYLLSTDWNKEPPGPSFPKEIIIKTAEKYKEALELITNRTYDF